MIVISAATGISTGFEKAWNATAKHGLARLIAVSQVDREHINYRKVLDDLRSTYGNCIIPTVLPIGEGTSFRGVVDVLTAKPSSARAKTARKSRFRKTWPAWWKRRWKPATRRRPAPAKN